MSECPKCEGKGFIILKNEHDYCRFERLPCVYCDATGIVHKFWHPTHELKFKILSKPLIPQNTCPFETVKKFKTGYSIKCPTGTTVVWTQSDITFPIDIKNKRDLECRKCIEKFFTFAKIAKVMC